MKRQLIILLAAMACVGAKAEVLDPSAALERALEGAPSSGARRALRGQKFRPVKTVAINSSDAELYVFESASTLMVVGAESEAPALLGYSEAYETGKPLPPALEMMLEAYAAEIASVRTNGAPARIASRADYSEIAPICTTTWDQSAPYNNLCPLLGGQRSVTGCVATAIAQVLKTYEYPLKGTGGTYSYFWKSGSETLSMDFSSTQFEWDKMLNSYKTSSPDENINAVATLMKACGYAADMNYTPDASGATAYALAAGLVRNLGFDPSLQYLERYYFSLADWTDKIYGELAAGHPVYYDGSTLNNEGHAFVVDGYQGDGYFHLNWGWGGLADGYFRLTALDPMSQGIGGASSGGGFDLRQGAIFGLKPDTGTDPASVPLVFFARGAFAINTQSVTLGSACSVSYTAYNGGNFTVKEVSPALCFTAENGAKYYSKAQSAAASVEVFSGFNFGAIPTSASLAAGNYVVTPAVYSGVTKQYYETYGPLSVGQSVAATVAGGRITFRGTQTPELTATGLKVPESIYPKREFQFEVTIENNTTVPYTGDAYLAICREGETIVRAYLSHFIVNVDGLSTETQKVIGLLQNANIAEGTYDVYILDSGRQIISNPAEVQVVVPDDLGTITASNMVVVGKTPDDVSVTVTLAAKNGNYTGDVWLQLHRRGDYNNYLVRYPASLKLKNGGSTEVTLGGPFPEGVPGQYYSIYLYYTHEGVETECSGRQRKTFQLEEGAAIDEISANQASEVQLYDLSGRKVASPRRGQIYVTNQKTKIIY